jgi:hypothetical protein
LNVPAESRYMLAESRLPDPSVISSATPVELEKATVPGALAVPRVALGVPSLWPMSAISEMSSVVKVVFPATIVPVASTDR